MNLLKSGINITDMEARLVAVLDRSIVAAGPTLRQSLKHIGDQGAQAFDDAAVQTICDHLHPHLSGSRENGREQAETVRLRRGQSRSGACGGEEGRRGLTAYSAATDELYAYVFHVGA